MTMRSALAAWVLLSVAGCGSASNEGQRQDAGGLVMLAADAVEVCGPPCAVVEEAQQVEALVDALNAGGEGVTTCDSGDQPIYTVRIREDGVWSEAFIVPASCGSTQGTAQPYKVTDEARALLNKVAEEAR